MSRFINIKKSAKKQIVKLLEKMLVKLKDKELTPEEKLLLAFNKTCQILNPNNDEGLALLLKNTYESIRHTTAISGTAGNTATLNKVIFPVMAMWYKKNLIKDIIGFKPISGPVVTVPLFVNKNENGRNTFVSSDETVTVKSRKLSARWTFEAAQDAQTENGVDLEAEIMAAWAAEVTTEYEMEIYTTLKITAAPAGTVKISEFEKEAARLKGQIATTSKRGPATFLIVNPIVYELLKITPAFKAVEKRGLGALHHVGSYNNMAVYVNKYAGDNDECIFGYKGQNESDAGMILCPYIPLTSTGVIFDPQTFVPVVSFMSRYGFLENPNSKDYYVKVVVDTTK